MSCLQYGSLTELFTAWFLDRAVYSMVRWQSRCGLQFVL